MAANMLYGCAAYRMGSDTLYAPDIQTVYIPMIEAESFRRDLGERLRGSRQGSRAQDAIQSRRHARGRQHSVGSSGE
jgi:hypothetical protein